VSRGLLDTSVLIAQLEAPELASLPEQAAISVATLAELHYGVLAAKDAATRRLRLQRLGWVEAAFEPLAIDADVARTFARVAHAVKQAGRQPRARTMDLWIAATALRHAIPLFTLNPDDFAPLAKLIEIRAPGEEQHPPRAS
jgi:predicted nucleic acid-binding protein